MPGLLYIGKRLAMAAVVLLTSVIITFLLVHLMPGSPGQIILGPGAGASAVHAENVKLGWTASWPTQFWRYLRELLQGNLGTSLINGGSVGSAISARLPVTTTIAVGAALCSAVIGIFAGVQAAVRGGIADRLVSSLAGVGISLPSFWIGIIFVYVFSVKLGWLPATGWVSFSTSPSQWLESIILPTATLTFSAAPAVARQTRAAMLDVLGREHIRTLRALGTPLWRVRYVHALRSASVPVVSLLGLQFVVLFGGTVVIEQIFALPGLGQGAQMAISSQDVTTIEAVVIISTLVVVSANLILDLAVLALDPKVRTR